MYILPKYVGTSAPDFYILINQVNGPNRGK
jgi:hypothetical protein